MRGKMTIEKKNRIPLFISDGDDMVFCDNNVYKELLEKTDNFTKIIDVMLIFEPF